MINYPQMLENNIVSMTVIQELVEYSLFTLIFQTRRLFKKRESRTVTSHRMILMLCTDNSLLDHLIGWKK